MEIFLMKILLVDDNVNDASILTRRLTKKGFNIRAVDNGKDCIETLKNDQEKTDLILMDMKMPVLDGYETTKILKQDPDLKNIPIIGVSAKAMVDEVKMAKDAGCDDYISKPINLDSLLSLIDKYQPAKAV